MTKNAKIFLIVGAVLLAAALAFKFLFADKPPGTRAQQRGVPSGMVLPTLR